MSAALVVALAAAAVPVLAAAPASAAPAAWSPAPAVPLTPETIDQAPHWAISAPATAQAALSADNGELALVTGTGGPSSGPAPVAAAAVAAVGDTVDAPGQWPTANRDRARTGDAAWEEFITVPAGAANVATTTDKVQLNPTIVDDVAYFGGAGTDRRVYAVDLHTQGLVASATLGGSVLSSPTVADGWVYFGAADGYVYRLSANEDLALSWKYPAGSPAGGFVGATALHNGVLFAGSQDGNVYAIDATTGALVWAKATPEAITAGVTVADGKVFVMSGANEWITVFDEATGTQLAQRHLYTWANPATLGTAASWSASTVYLTGLDAKLYILNPDTTDAAPPVTLGSSAQNTPVTAVNKVFVGTNDGRVLAFTRTGGFVWARTLNPGTTAVITSPIFARNWVFAASTDGALYAVNATTGVIDWRYSTGGSLFAAPAIVSGHIVIGSDDHNVYFLEPGVPDNRTFAPPPVSHTFGLRVTIQYSWDPVATSTGNYTTTADDITIPGRGVPVGFARTYNSLDAATNGPLGYGWTFNAGAAVTTAPGTATVRWGDGHTDTYTVTGPTYTAPPDVFDTLTAVAGGGWDITNPNSHVRYRFNPAGRLTAIVDPSGNQTTLAYNGAGQLVSMTDASAHTVTLGYDPTGRINRATDPLGRHWDYTYDPAGNLATAADNAGHTWRYGYNPAHHLTTMTDPDNNLVIDNTYNPGGQVTDQTDAAGGHWGYTYSAGTTVVTDPLGQSITYTHDADYRTTTITDPLGATTRWIYDEHSNLAATIDATGRAAQYHHDGFGNVTARLDALGHKTAYGYDANRNLTSITNLAGQTATFAYDPANRLTDTTTPTGVGTHVTYRADGLVDTVTDGAGKTTRYGYDANGMPRTVTDPLARVTTIAVNATGETTTSTDPLLRVTGYHYDPAGRLDVVTDPDSHTARYGYDNTGRTTTYTDPNGRTTHYHYDTRGLPTGSTDPLGRRSTVGYDLARRPTSRTNARNQVIGYGYDHADRLTTVDYPNAPDVTATYDPAGRPLTTTDGTGTTTWTYDTAGRPTTEHRDLANTTLTTRWDMLGRRRQLSLTRDGGLTARNAYTYDPDGRLAVLTDSTGSETLFDYDPAGRTGTISQPNGVATSYGYDDAGQLTDITNTRAATATSTANLVSSYHYTYDTAGQRSAMARTVAGQAFTNTYRYDKLGRITAATSNDPQAPPDANATWAYDPAGNRITQTVAGALATSFTYDDADQLGTDGTVDYTWDADGNLTARRARLGGATLATYSWDAANRITAQTVAGQTTTYGYDNGGRRVTKTDAGGTSTYLYDGSDLLEELTTSASGGDAVETTAGGLVLNRTTAAGTTYLHPDGNANIGETTDTNGTLTTRQAYSPWGNHTTVPTASGTDPYLNRHTFAGAQGVRDDNGGLLDMRNRLYDPTLGRFLSNDPLQSATHQGYRYALGNPISNTDPAGLESSGSAGPTGRCYNFNCPLAAETARPDAYGTSCSQLGFCLQAVPDAYGGVTYIQCPLGDCGYGPNSTLANPPATPGPDLSFFEQAVGFIVNVGNCLVKGTERAGQFGTAGFVLGSAPNPFITVTPAAGAVGGTVVGAIEGCIEGIMIINGP